jgi:hypothetical protein
LITNERFQKKNIAARMQRCFAFKKTINKSNR